ncbi:MAG: hypothetical protein ABI955_13235, partial [Nitrospirota bacterium]
MGHIQKKRQADRMFRQGIVTSIVSKFDEYLVMNLKVSCQINPGWLKNPDKKITYKELLEIQSLEDLKGEIVQKEIDSLMRDSHQAQIIFLDSRIKLGIEQGFPQWLDFLEVTERRNLFVHTGGSVSSQYIENCQRWKITLDSKIKEGVHLSASDDYIQRAVDCFYEISVRLTQALVRRLFPECFSSADSILNNRTVELLIQERWELAERLFEFAMGIPKELTSKGEMEFYFLINICIARKFGGKPFSERLHSVDWKPFHPKYHLAVAILEDRFDEAERLMRSQAVLDQLSEQHFKEWPLLRDFRRTEAFLNAFRDIFKKDYAKELLEEAQKEMQAQENDTVDNTP